jgi:hypothetical protein
LLVLLTVFALLACPFNCMGNAAVCDAEDERPTRCSCCHHSPEEGSSDSGRPAAPDDDCGCSNCLCRGAILPDDHPLDVADAVLELPPSDAPAMATGRAGALRVTAGSFPPYDLQSGRLIRFALQSLQL